MPTVLVTFKWVSMFCSFLASSLTKGHNKAGVFDHGKHFQSGQIFESKSQGRHDTHHNDNQHNNKHITTQHTDIQQNGTRYRALC